MIEYKARLVMDDNYKVVKIENTFLNEDEYDENESKEETVYQGRLADCEAYIRLKESGYIQDINWNIVGDNKVHMKFTIPIKPRKKL